MTFLDKTGSRSRLPRPNRFPAFLDKIRRCPCLVCGGQAEAAHVRMSSAAHGKPFGKDDRWCAPLCPDDHRLGPDCQHNSREETWWAGHGIDILSVCERLWAARGDQEAMIEICVEVMP